MDRRMCGGGEVMIINQNSQIFCQIHKGDTVWIGNYANGQKMVDGNSSCKKRSSFF